MHAGSLTGDAAAARVYRQLRAHAGEWQSAWNLTLDCRTTAVSTRISEVRHQLDDGWEVESLYRDGHWYYRLVRREVMEPLLC